MRFLCSRAPSRWMDLASWMCIMCISGVPPRVLSHCCSFMAVRSFVVVFLSGLTYGAVGPGSFLEVTKVLPFLTAVSDDHPSFHVVAPSLPGYAWSEAVLEKGFHAEHYAEVSDI